MSNLRAGEDKDRRAGVIYVRIVTSVEQTGEDMIIGIDRDVERGSRGSLLRIRVEFDSNQTNRFELRTIDRLALGSRPFE